MFLETCVTTPINQMSDMPSAQSTRPTNNGAKKNFVWQAQDIECLVDTIYIHKSYQHIILPSCHNKANKPANKLCKDTVHCDLCKSLFPARAVDPSHIKFKVHWLQETVTRMNRCLFSKSGAFGSENAYTSVLCESGTPAKGLAGVVVLLLTMFQFGYPIS
ncbi:uncharacterized protein UBRO_20702 [Ustilago bromivora]|uniref:Uncharacterized protein n=1 Tax=Ustilago bromivora TaxID=307758 RepID=A0A1K0H880_9BASI|nr:uncharacterized protein UBRO_20702 [Ustilago bromivora]